VNPPHTDKESKKTYHKNHQESSKPYKIMYRDPAPNGGKGQSPLLQSAVAVKASRGVEGLR
jgi:hypothetical protein